MESTSAFYAEDKRTLWQRLMTRMFPVRRIEIPDDLEGWSPNYIHIEIISCLDWKDRLRILLSGVVCTQTIMKTDVSVQKMESKSVIYVSSPSQKRKAGG